MKVKWWIDEDESAETDIDLPNDDRDPEKKWFEIYLKDLGFKPIKVNEG